MCVHPEQAGHKYYTIELDSLMEVSFYGIRSTYKSPFTASILSEESQLYLGFISLLITCQFVKLLIHVVAEMSM